MRSSSGGYSVYSSLSLAWPSWPSASLGAEPLVEIATTDFADDRFGEEVEVDTARFWLGLPSA